MDGLILIILIAIFAIPGLVMMNIGVWQLKKAGSAFGDIRKQNSDQKFFAIQKKFYAINPGKTESDFVQWYTDKKIEFSDEFGAYDPPRFSKWLVEKNKPSHFYVLDRDGYGASVQRDSSQAEMSKSKSTENQELLGELFRLKQEVTQMFFAEFPGSSQDDFERFQADLKAEVQPDGYKPSFDYVTEEILVWTFYHGWLNTNDDGSPK